MTAPPDVKAAKPSGRFRKVEVRTWGDEKFRALSPIQPSGQGLWLYLITGPHTGPIPGLFSAGPAAMAEDLKWSTEAFRKAFREVLAQGMVEADFDNRVVWIPKALIHNPPASPNVVLSWASEFELIPECDLKREAYEGLKASIHAVGGAFGKAFDDSFRKPSPKPTPKTMANQEQEQEQEKEKEQEQNPNQGKPPPDPGPPAGAGGAGGPSSSAPPPRSPRGRNAEAKPKAAHRAPAAWLVSSALQQWAREKAPLVDIHAETESFRDCEFRVAHTDWDATWRTWMRKAQVNAQTRHPRINGSAPAPDDRAARHAAVRQAMGLAPITDPGVIDA